MALIKSGVVLDSGLEVNGSYVVVESVGGSKNRAVIDVQYFVSKAAREDAKTPVKVECYVFEPSVAEDAPNFIKQGYEYIKSLPEFLEATDA